ncbi:hypothetical protein MRP26_21510 [Bacillus sp. CCB-MMP212]|uniref:hypothetical protein n=1 Tax=Bacillus sp. CCB-MMP212 TaxID=2928002 RepID=UPI001F623A4E|nr:hypothetical protein [Bacillus sp. CCB-MMP212]MCI4251508.1 hypothetical protein [Bacillus sp. CCB-MMP212]
MNNNYWYLNPESRFLNNPSGDLPNVNLNHQALMSQYRDERTLGAERGRISLKATKGTGIDLGDGFESFKWEGVDIGTKGKISTVFMIAPDMKVINAGWATVLSNTALRIVDHFPFGIGTWVITLVNETPKDWDPNPQSLMFYLIAKS